VSSADDTALFCYQSYVVSAVLLVQKWTLDVIFERGMRPWQLVDVAVVVAADDDVLSSSCCRCSHRKMCLLFVS
jgi:hypothetical protein